MTCVDVRNVTVWNVNLAEEYSDRSVLEVYRVLLTIMVCREGYASVSLSPLLYKLGEGYISFVLSESLTF